MAGKLMFRTIDVEKVAPGIEEVLRKEINLPFPIPYTVQKVDLSNVKVDSFGVALGKVIGISIVDSIVGSTFGIGAVGGTIGDIADTGVNKVLWKKNTTLGTITFTISRPRPVNLLAGIVRLRMDNCVVPLVFTTTLSKSINGKVELRRTGSGIYVRGNFIGDEHTAARLNAAPDLVKRIAKFTRDRYKLITGTRGEFSIEPFFILTPQASDTLLTCYTTVIPADFIHGPRINIQEFFAISSLVEALLGS